MDSSLQVSGAKPIGLHHPPLCNGRIRIRIFIFDPHTIYMITIIDMIINIKKNVDPVTAAKVLCKVTKIPEIKKNLDGSHPTHPPPIKKIGNP